MLKRIGLLIGIYPIVAHFGLWTSHPRLAVSYLVGLLLVILLSPPRFSQVKNIVAASLLIFGVVALAIFKLDYMLIYLPPIFIPSMLMVVFLQSLKLGQVPLITRFAMKIEGDLDNERINYTRNVTKLWVIVFAFMVIEAVSLAFYSSINVWSWATHVGNYILIAFVLVAEFIYRKYRFKQNKSFKEFIAALIQHRWNKSK